MPPRACCDDGTRNGRPPSLTQSQSDSVSPGPVDQRSYDHPPSPKHAGGRPRVTATPAQVGRLRQQGLGWRRIGRTLGIGTATSMRLYDGRRRSPEASQNSRQEGP
jgi:hypothetical protein